MVLLGSTCFVWIAKFWLLSDAFVTLLTGEERLMTSTFDRVASETASSFDGKVAVGLKDTQSVPKIKKTKITKKIIKNQIIKTTNN